ncbi:DUF5678 domain-containing protein [Jatrophihabitans lederbergiae]|uniref:DUF5678 domain-containing protein n=1 Tax=Jatrophihabitans lederbergiae TaxID=3075547 RepID=A0ABU2JEL2_9ACTN|nr:DUF5678 domain-containing protein [Jatrophihabitans sp. DSM 44399]MDT0263420.1 DUF5678 domain-containing protein [Jatrophihabitans sp. DSM 44399]
MPDLDTRDHAVSGPVRLRTRKGLEHELTLDAILTGARAVTTPRPSRVWVQIDERLLPAIDVITQATGHTTSENLFTWIEITRVLKAFGLSVHRGTGQWTGPEATEPGFSAGSYARHTTLAPVSDVDVVVPAHSPGQLRIDADDASGMGEGREDQLVEPPLTAKTAAMLTEHAGRWVALRDQHVVAVADSPTAVSTEAHAASDSPIMVVFVPETGTEDPALP